MLKFQGFRWLLREAVPGLRPDLIFSRKPGTETLRILTPRSQDEKKKTPRGDENFAVSLLYTSDTMDEKKKTPRGDENMKINRMELLKSTIDEKKKTPRGDENNLLLSITGSHILMKKRRPREGTKTLPRRRQLSILLLYEKKKTPRGDENSYA